jgi:hypothetical protein
MISNFFINCVIENKYGTIAMKQSILITFIALLCMVTMNYISLSVTPDLKSKMEIILEEKLKLSKEQIKSILSNVKLNKSFPEKLSQDRMDAISSFAESVVSTDPLPESELHAAINPKDSSNIVVSAMRFDTQNLTQALLCPVYYTSDFGKTWRKSGFQNLPSVEGALVLGGGDPIFCFDPDGKLYFTWINLYLDIYDTSFPVYGSVFWTFSTDGGKTFQRMENDIISGTEGVFDLTSPTIGLSGIWDKQWMTSGLKGCANEGDVYTGMAYVSIDNGKESGDIYLLRKKKNEALFDTMAIPVSQGEHDFCQFTAIDIDPLSNVHIIFTGIKDNKLTFHHSVSTNGGDNFSLETKITDFQFSGSESLTGGVGDSITGISKPRLYPCPQMAIDRSGGPRNGWIYFTWTGRGTNQLSTTGFDIYLTISKDGGKNWSEPAIVNDDKLAACEQFYSSISVNSEGVLAISWYDRRNDPGNILTDYFLAYSFDGGESFTKQFKVNNKSTDFRSIGYLNSGFGIGEYCQLLTTKGYAIPVWTDGSFNDGDLNLYAGFIPINSDPTSVSIERISGVNCNAGFSVLGIDPNGSIDMKLNLEKYSSIDIELYSIDGREILKIENIYYEAGEHIIQKTIGKLAHGSYFIMCKINNCSFVEKIEL